MHACMDGWMEGGTGWQAGEVASRTAFRGVAMMKWEFSVLFALSPAGKLGNILQLENSGVREGLTAGRSQDSHLESDQGGETQLEQGGAQQLGWALLGRCWAQLGVRKDSLRKWGGRVATWRKSETP